MKDIIRKFHLAPLSCLFLVLVFFYFPVLFLGRTLQGPEMARMNLDLKSPPSTESIYDGKVMPQIFNTEQATAAYQRFPNDMLLGKMIHSFELPLWNAHQGIGIPFAAQYETSAFFPFRIIQDAFPTSARDWFFILHMWLAGVFTYCFFIFGSKINRISALFGACTYMGCGAFSWFMQLQDYMSVSMILPLLMLAAHQLSVRNTGRYIAFLAISTMLILFTGQPEAAFYCLVLSSIYYLFKVYSTGKESTVRAYHLITFFASTILGIMLASPLLFLFAELFQHAFSIHSDVLHNDPNMIAGLKARTPLFILPGILFPQLLEWPIMPLALPAAGSWDFIGSYVGIVSFYFFIAGCFLQHPILKKDFVFFTLFAITILMMDTGLWPFNLIGYLPLFRQAWSPRWAGAAWSFALISACTYGFYFLQNCRYKTVEWKSLIKKTAIITGVVFYICIAVGYEGNHLTNSYIFLITSLYQPWTNLTTCMFFGIGSLGLITYYLLKNRNDNNTWRMILIILIISLWYALPKGNCMLPFFEKSLPVNMNFFISKMILLIIALYFLTITKQIMQGKVRIAILMSLLIFSIITLYQQVVLPGYPHREHVEKKTPFITFIENHAQYDRTFGFNGILMPVTASAYAIYDIRFIVALSYEPYQYFIEDYLKEQKISDIRQWFDANKHAVNFDISNKEHPIVLQKTAGNALNLLSVKYVITKKSEDMSWITQYYSQLSNQLKLVYSDEHVNIFENTTALPRVFMVSKFVLENSYHKAQALAMQPGFDLAHTAVLDKNISFTLSNATPLDATATISEYHNNKVIIATHANQNAILVLTDIYYPGWTATIDGKEADFFRVDGLVRGILVPAGNHTVVYHYLPSLFQWGLVLFIIALSTCLILFFVSKENI